MRTFACIAAMDEKCGIGFQERLPWNLPGDLRHFQEITKGKRTDSKQNVVIMGRKTWDSLPEKRRPLSGRLNVVLTRDLEASYPAGVLKAGSLDDALAQVDARPDTGDVFVIGGAGVFVQAMEHPGCSKLLLTEIEGAFNADTFFPDSSLSFQKTWTSGRQEENGIRYRFTVYERTV